MYVTDSFQKEKQKRKPTAEELELQRGIELVRRHPLFGSLPNRIYIEKWKAADASAVVDLHGVIKVNCNARHSAAEWANMIAHCALHNAFGHFDAKKLSECQKQNQHFDKRIWNQACDIYITRFLADMKFGQSLAVIPEGILSNYVSTEAEIYQQLIRCGQKPESQLWGTASVYQLDMDGLDTPLSYKQGFYRKNAFAEAFSQALVQSVSHSIDIAGGTLEKTTGRSLAQQAANWFIDHYPLLGALAASFRIIEDSAYCIKHQIQIAAIDVDRKEIYVNPSVYLTEQEWRFVLAHEYLHSGLCHTQRCQGRDFQIWNLACDFVINGWLWEMQIGTMPSVGLLYDAALSGLSAETIYDMLMQNLRKSRKLNTFRGYGMGDMIQSDRAGLPYGVDYTTFDDVCREALAQGLEYHQSSGRGLLPAGLVEEIKSLSMPPVPWDVKLAYWFQEYLPLPERRRTYARPSRRQGTTPDIPRPKSVQPDEWQKQHTFGVVIDTSGSMSHTELGMALGAIASYAAAREVQRVRVVFCDATAYDAGYLSVEELTDRVQVKGRGGTRLQPAVDLLENAEDFPKDGPILLITDGMIEPKVTIQREHAWLIPKGGRLPFRTTASVFYYA